MLEVNNFLLKAVVLREDVLWSWCSSDVNDVGCRRGRTLKTSRLVPPKYRSKDRVKCLNIV